MIGIAEAIEIVIAAVHAQPQEEVGLAAAFGRVLAGDIVALRDVPAFANSQMDGFAVRASDVRGAGPAQPVRLRVSGTLAAGSAADLAVSPGCAVRIMTGAPIPRGADAVVRVEDTESVGDQVAIQVEVPPGQFVRPAGEDVRAGETVLERGRVIGEADVGLIASLGRPTVPVGVRPRVAILATGDELVPLGEPLGPGQIYNSNAYTLAAAVRRSGGEPVPFGIVRDDRDSLRAAYLAAARCDAILSTGGVSVGDFDYVKQIMDEIGLERRFWQVAQKPGKPITFAEQAGRLYFGLPGNPVSALVCFDLYVAPALRRSLGMREVFAPTAEVTMAESVATARGLTELVRCTLADDNGRLVARPTGTQSSGALRSLSLADALVISPAGQATLDRGERAQALLVRDHRLAATHPFAPAPA
ncbi:MAG TPA: gephyrin-like molybdotransferase Glp [Candidatus Bathyarchaeia archaeon]|nr:gephyrin-like molybdotransferase Glp [Candidatus Bathyarchaeia archaeon]